MNEINTYNKAKLSCMLACLPVTLIVIMSGLNSIIFTFFNNVFEYSTFYFIAISIVLMQLIPITSLFGLCLGLKDMKESNYALIGVVMSTIQLVLIGGLLFLIIN